MQPLWKAVWKFLKKLKTELPYTVLICLSSLYILDSNPLLDMSFANIFSHLDCLLVLLIVSFTVQKILILIYKDSFLQTLREAIFLVTKKILTYT